MPEWRCNLIREPTVTVGMTEPQCAPRVSGLHMAGLPGPWWELQTCTHAHTHKNNITLRRKTPGLEMNAHTALLKVVVEGALFSVTPVGSLGPSSEKNPFRW